MELLAPAGDLEKLKFAVMYGADAVFIGGKNFSLRKRASNFTIDDIKEGVKFAHKYNTRVHVTCNIVMHESDLDNLLEYLKELDDAGVDAIITSSLYMLKLIKKHTSMEAHFSTQASVLNSNAVNFLKEQGADRVVLGRELSLDEISLLRSRTDVELEIFIHGGMCASFSGRCMLSNIMTKRDANRGGCAHSCRWNYNLYYNDVLVNPASDFFSMSSKDLSCVSIMDQILKLGCNSFKIEGRMKSIHYVASVTNVYRKMIDEYNKTGFIKDFNYYKDLINKAENRLTSTGFYLNGVTNNEQLYDLNKSVPTKAFIAIVKSYDEKSKRVFVEQRNHFLEGSKIEIITPTDIYYATVLDLKDSDGFSVSVAPNPLSILSFKLDFYIPPFSIIRGI